MPLNPFILYLLFKPSPYYSYTSLGLSSKSIINRKLLSYIKLLRLWL